MKLLENCLLRLPVSEALMACGSTLVTRGARSRYKINGNYSEFSVRREISAWELSKRNFTLGEFVRIPIQHSFYLSYFLIANSILHVEILRGDFLPGWNCIEYLFIGKNIHPVEYFHIFQGRNSPWGSCSRDYQFFAF